MSLPTTRTAAEERIAAQVEAAKERLDTALSALSSDQQREFVHAFAVTKDWRSAALAAGYNEGHLTQEVTRLQRNPKLRLAIEAAASLRAADLPPLTKQALVDRLWAMMQVRKTDLLQYNERGQAVRLTDWHTLPIAYQKALTKFKFKVYGSKGRHADYRDIDVETTDPVRIAEAIGRLMGWVKPTQNVAAVQLRSPIGTAGVSLEDAGEAYRRLVQSTPIVEEQL